MHITFLRLDCPLLYIILSLRAILVASGENAIRTHEMPCLAILQSFKSRQKRQQAADGAIHASVWLFLLKPPMRQKSSGKKSSLVAKCVRGATLDKFVMEIKPFHAVN
jgi:hypothetical protein